MNRHQLVGSDPQSLASCCVQVEFPLEAKAFSIMRDALWVWFWEPAVYLKMPSNAERGSVPPSSIGAHSLRDSPISTSLQLLLTEPAMSSCVLSFPPSPNLSLCILELGLREDVLGQVFSLIRFLAHVASLKHAYPGFGLPVIPFSLLQGKGILELWEGSGKVDPWDSSGARARGSSKIKHVFVKQAMSWFSWTLTQPRPLWTLKKVEL